MADNTDVKDTKGTDAGKKTGSFVSKHKNAFIIGGVVVGLVLIYIFYRANQSQNSSAINGETGNGTQYIQGPQGPQGPAGKQGRPGRPGKTGPPGNNHHHEHQPHRHGNPGGKEPEPPRRHPAAVINSQMGAHQAGMPHNPTHNTIPHENPAAVRSAPRVT